jgi:two-component system chemotaxis response regulator CheB
VKRVRVVVVDDSLTVRKRLCEILAADPEIEVIAEAEDGRQAIEHCQRLRPDVISMDMMMPVMSGLSATEFIMAHCPTPILVVSSSTNRGEMYRTYDALAAGAVDVMEKLPRDSTDGRWEATFVATLKLVARIRVISRRWGNPQVRTIPAQVAGRPITVRQGEPIAVVAVGASTGGPAAVAEMLHGLPASLTVPMLLVVHIGAPFAAVLTDWLDDQTKRTVRYAVDGEPVAAAAGQVVVATPDRHLMVRERRLRLVDSAERYSCRPSVDVLFESVATEYGSAAAACLLTGMGRDGAAGLGMISSAGGLTIAQDEATSVVWGMPGAAVALGAAALVLPLAEIGPNLAAAVANRSVERRAR